jgi:endonuclease-3
MVPGTVFPAGFYRTKAAILKKIAEILLDNYGGKVPNDMESLLAFPEVGRKTANLVLSETFDKDAICVDIHVHRISNRLGFFGVDGTNDPLETEIALRSILLCSRYIIGNHCPRLNVGRSR